METFETPNGKKIGIYNDGFNLRVKFLSGGELPAELAGIWTSFTRVKDSIDKYIQNKFPKEMKRRRSQNA